MVEQPEDLSFTVETQDGPVRAVISPAVLRRLSGRTHVDGAELLSIYRYELGDIVQRKIAGSAARARVRIEASDL